MTAEQQKNLIEALWNTFERDCFDVPKVCGQADYSPQLMAAIEASAPDCKYRAGYRRGRLKDKAVRRVLSKLADQCFITDRLGWWHLKPKTL
jgi:hypothetical protein